MKRPSEWSRHELVALCSGLAMLLMLVVICGVLLLTGGHGNGSRVAAKNRPRRQGAVKYVSGGLSRTDIVDLGQARHMSEIFWLGPPAKGVRLVTDTHRQTKEIQLAYLDRWAQRQIQRGKVAYSVLVITQALDKKSEEAQEAQLKKMAGMILKRDGFTIYLPSKKYLGQHRFFMISADRRWGGVVDYGSNATVAEVRAIARKVQVIRIASK